MTIYINFRIGVSIGSITVSTTPTVTSTVCLTLTQLIDSKGYSPTQLSKGPIQSDQKRFDSLQDQTSVVEGREVEKTEAFEKEHRMKNTINDKLENLKVGTCGPDILTVPLLVSIDGMDNYGVLIRNEPVQIEVERRLSQATHSGLSYGLQLVGFAGR